MHASFVKRSFDGHSNLRCFFRHITLCAMLAPVSPLQNSDGTAMSWATCRSEAMHNSARLLTLPCEASFKIRKSQNTNVLLDVLSQAHDGVGCTCL